MIDPKKYVKVVSKQQATPVAAGNYVNILNQDITVTENGVYTAEEGYTGLGTVIVDVPTEASGSVSFTENGTYNIAQYASVTVAVPMNTTSLTVTENGTYTPGGSNIGFSSVSVAVPNQTTSITINYNGTYYPDSPYIGFDSVTVSMYVESLTITPTTSTQTYYGTDEVAGYSPVIVEAVTSAIDPNIQASNIKSGVSILGVTGNAQLAPAYYIERTNSSGTLQTTGVSRYISLSGVTKVGEFALGFAFAQNTVDRLGPSTMPDLSNITRIETYGLYYAFAHCSQTTGSVDLSGLTFVNSNGCTNAFWHCWHITSAIIGSATATIGYYSNCFYNMFGYCSLLQSAEIRFKEINGSGACTLMFVGCNNLQTIQFTNLQKLSNSSVLYAMCRDCTTLQTMSFPALLSNFTSYTNVFDNMLSGCSNVTVHFPSNLQSVIGSWTSVTNGFGGTNTTVLFDLPATA